MADAIHITRWGDAGPRVVMVHGSAQGSALGGDHHFARQHELAGRGWQLWVPDRPGHGQSPSPGRPDDAEADGAWLAELLGDTAGGAHLVGHSFGGCVALNAAARRPTAVKTLTLIEPAVMPLAMHSPAVRRMGLRMLAAMWLSFTPAQRIRRFVKLVNIPPDLRGSSDPATLARMGRAIRALRVPKATALREQLARIREAHVPLRVVTGGWSAAFEDSADEAAKQGGGQRWVIASPHHFPQRVSDEFNDRLEAFMQAHEAPRA